MSNIKRRDFLKISAGLAAGAAGGVPLLAEAQSQAWKPEKGARLRVLRWKRFVQGDEDMWMKNTAEFAKRTGVAVRVDHEGWEDVRPKAAVAANVGSGPDIILSTFDDANLYPEKLLDVTDLAEYLGKKYGGWYDVCRQYLQPGGKRWIGLPLGCAGNTWTHWLLWSFGGKLVDEKNNVVVDSPQTIQALEYAKELYPTFVPGTLAWLDPNNNKAFLDDQISITENGISIYYAAKNSQDPKIKAMAADIGHANLPIGPVGRPTELHLFFNQMIFKYTKYPNAAKEYLRFMMEKEQYEPWQKASIGYVTHPLKAYESNPIWTEDPKHTPYRDCMKIMLPNGYGGKLGYSSAQCMADFIVVNMVAEAASGARTPKEAAERAQKRAERYYKV